MRKIKYNKILIAFILGILSFTPSSSAQTSVFAPPGIDEQISSTVTPSLPGPNETVTILIESFSANFNKSYIVWKVNGVTQSEGAGVTRFTFSNGRLGTLTEVKAEISTNDGRYFEKKFTFEPASVNLAYEALTYTPPFYKGKALFTPQSSIKVVALPEFVMKNGTVISPQNLVYTWRKDNRVLQDQSGFGRQSAIIEGEIITRPMTISVEVSAIGSNLKGSQALYIEPSEPELHLYEDSLLYGIDWNKEIGGSYFMGSRNELKVIAEPYFFSTTFPQSSDLLYTWGLNNQKVNLAPNQNYLGLKNETGESGSSNVSVSIESKDKLLQASERSMILDFTRTP